MLQLRMKTSINLSKRFNFRMIRVGCRPYLPVICSSKVRCDNYYAAYKLLNFYMLFVPVGICGKNDMGHTRGFPLTSHEVRFTGVQFKVE